MEQKNPRQLSGPSIQLRIQFSCQKIKHPDTLFPCSSKRIRYLSQILTLEQLVAPIPKIASVWTVALTDGEYNQI